MRSAGSVTLRVDTSKANAELRRIDAKIKSLVAQMDDLLAKAQAVATRLPNGK